MQRVKPVEERECYTYLSAYARRPCSHGCQSTSGAPEELYTLVTSCVLTGFDKYYPYTALAVQGTAREGRGGSY